MATLRGYRQDLLRILEKLTNYYKLLKGIMQMDNEQQEIYNEGYQAYSHDKDEALSNPYSGLDAEFWSDGWADAEEDEAQRET